MTITWGHYRPAAAIHATPRTIAARSRRSSHASTISFIRSPRFGLTNRAFDPLSFPSCCHDNDIVATWPNGSGKGLQSPLSGFDSRRRLHISAGHRAGDSPAVTEWSQFSKRLSRSPVRTDTVRTDPHGSARTGRTSATGSRAQTDLDGTSRHKARGSRATVRRCISRAEMVEPLRFETLAPRGADPRKLAGR